MNTDTRLKVFFFAIFSVTGITISFAQENDFYKQMIKESFKFDLQNDLMLMNMDSLPYKAPVVLDVNKKPLPNLGYNLEANSYFLKIMDESLENIQKMDEMNKKINNYLLTPYTNPSYNPVYSKLMYYQNMVPEKTLNDLMGAGTISLNTVADKIMSSFKKQKSTERTFRYRFKESEKSSIIERTNLLILENYYADYITTLSDSIPSDTIQLNITNPLNDIYNAPLY